MVTTHSFNDLVHCRIGMLEVLGEHLHTDQSRSLIDSVYNCTFCCASIVVVA